MNLLNDLLASVRNEGKSILEGSTSPRTTSKDEVPKPTTWEYLIEVLIQVGVGEYVHLNGIIQVMKVLGWSTKSGSEVGTYRTVHSSTYKSITSNRKGYICKDASTWIDTTHSKDGMYALLPGVDEELQSKHSEWILGRRWDDEIEEKRNRAFTRMTEHSLENEIEDTE